MVLAHPVLCLGMQTAVPGLKLSVLSAICNAIDQALDLGSALDNVLRILSEQLAMQRATVTLHDQEVGQLAIVASCGLSSGEMRRGTYRLDEGVTGRIFRTGLPYYVPDVGEEPLFLNRTGARSMKRGTISFLGVPIVMHGDPVGVLNVDRLFEDGVDVEEDIEFLKVVATLIGQFVSLNEKVRERESYLKWENASLKFKISERDKRPSLVGRSPIIADVRRQVKKVASTRATVLLLGESGVGKTRIARFIHDLSERKQHPFVPVNCASIPVDQLEAELFGKVNGGNGTAGVSRPGRYEEADSGTLFLDEVDALPKELQVKLLNALQDKVVKRVGGERARPVDVRILAATNRDLGDMVERGLFRLDLFYRLNVFPLHIPPLRERREDVTPLLNHFLRKAADNYRRSMRFTATALDALTRYDWPGNVREMQNLIERLVVMADDDRITLAFLKSYLAPGQSAAAQDALTEPEDPPRIGSLREFERNEVMAALERSGWIQYKAAHSLGLSPRQMGYRVKKYGLEPMIAEGRARVRRAGR